MVYFTNPAIFQRTIRITDDLPQVTIAVGSAVTSWTVQPPLPAGLTLDPLSGVISGTPTVVAQTATYTIIASNSGGSVQVDVLITGAELKSLPCSFLTPCVVNDIAPASLFYLYSNATYYRAQTIPPNIPTAGVVGGVITSYSVSPPLPLGLKLNASGIIVGSPITVSPRTRYTVTGRNT